MPNNEYAELFLPNPLICGIVGILYGSASAVGHIGFMVGICSGLGFCLSHIKGHVSTPTTENVQPYYRSPFLLAIIAYSLAKGKLFSPRSRGPAIHRDVQRGLTFLGSSDNIVNRCKMQYNHNRRGDKGLALPPCRLSEGGKKDGVAIPAR
jgi:hypothetical protein